jgi:predicted RNase H-like HicB family nuclease
MVHADFELLPKGEGFFGHIPELRGVWANAESLEACRERLQDALEGWILLRVRFGWSIPEIDGIAPDPPPALPKRGREHNVPFPRRVAGAWSHKIHAMPRQAGQYTSTA